MLPARVLTIAEMSVRTSWNKREKFLKLGGGKGTKKNIEETVWALTSAWSCTFHLASLSACLQTNRVLTQREIIRKNRGRQGAGKEEEGRI